MPDSDPTLDQLLSAIRTETGRSAVAWADPPVTLSGGFWAEMWRVRLAGTADELFGDLVARVMPDAHVAARETLVQAHLAADGFPTPTVRLAAGPGPDLDRAWMLMDLAPGQPMLDNLSGPSALARLPRLARSLPDRLATHAARLHALDSTGLAETLDVGDEAADLVEALHDQACGLGRADLAETADWLVGHRPAGDAAVICHGDLHPFNILTAPEGDTVLDWSSSRIAHPAYDLAFTRLLLSRPPLVTPRAVRPFVEGAGRALSGRFLRSYAAESGRAVDADQLHWFTLLQGLRILTEVANIESQAEPGQRANHPFFALRGPIAARLAAATGLAVET